MRLSIGAGLLTAAVLWAAAPYLASAAETGHHAAAPQAAEGTGVIKAIDPKAPSVTIRHDPIPALKWPAMTMKFPVQSAELLNGLKVGAPVEFSLVNHNGHPMVSAIRPKQ